MWILLSFCSALFAGITSILAKCGIRKTNSTLATAIRTIVVLAFSILMVFVSGSYKGIYEISAKTWIFLVLSGLATGASWLCYFKALQLGDINKVVPIDKSSVVITMVFAFIFLGEGANLYKWIAIVLIAIGTFMMIEKKQVAEDKNGNGRAWLLFAFGSAIFASLTAILAKLGISGVESNLGTAIRTTVVLAMSWLMVLIQPKSHERMRVDRNELWFIILSGIATGASWLCYYRALQIGPLSAVAAIDKSSILVSILFSFIVFGERLSKKAFIGLLMIIAGTLAMVFL